jgi:hypothetical protein
MRRRWIALLALGFAAPVFGQDADPYEVKVRGLSHPRYVEREKAARDLEAAGEPALKALRVATKSADPDLRTRASAIVERIDRTLLSKKLLVAPTLSLKFDKVPLQQAVTQLSQKTGLRFQLDMPKGPHLQTAVTLDTGDVPYWQAIQAFYEAANLMENDLPSNGTSRFEEQNGRRRIYSSRLVDAGAGLGVIRLTDGKGTLPAELSKAIRVRALPTAFAQNKYDAQTGEVTFHLDVDCAPGLDMRELIGVEVRRAVAEDRRALAPAYPPAQYSPGFHQEELLIQQAIIINGEMVMDGGGGSPSFHPVTLKCDGTRPRQLAEVEGVVVARVMGPAETLVQFADLFGKGKGQSQSRDGVSMTLKSAEKMGSSTSSLANVRVRIVTSVDNVNEMLNFPVQVKGRIRPFLRINRGGGAVAPSPNSNEFQFRDAEGQPLKIVSTRLMETSADGMTLSQEVELRIELPKTGTEGITMSLNGRRPALVEMPFVLKNVPLP